MCYSMYSMSFLFCFLCECSLDCFIQFTLDTRVHSFICILNLSWMYLIYNVYSIYTCLCFITIISIDEWYCIILSAHFAMRMNHMCSRFNISHIQRWLKSSALVSFRSTFRSPFFPHFCIGTNQKWWSIASKKVYLGVKKWHNIKPKLGHVTTTTSNLRNHEFSSA